MAGRRDPGVGRCETDCLITWQVAASGRVDSLAIDHCPLEGLSVME